MNFPMNRVVLFNNSRISFMQIAKFTSPGKDLSRLSKLIEARKKDNKEILNPRSIENEDSLQKLITIDEPMNISKISDVPEEHISSRLVRIFKPSKNVMQSGTNNTHHWRIAFETRERWENPLMGWVSSGDPLANLHVDFQNKEEAIAHCEKNGWKYIVDYVEPVTKTRSKSYAVNFSWNKRTRVSTK